MGRNAKLKESQKWSHEKPKLDNARRLRGMYFFDPEDKEFEETIKNAHKKLETPMAPAMLCKTSKKSKHGETRLRLREVWIWVNTVFILTSLKTEVARSVTGPKLQEHRAEDAVAKPYLVQKILVI